MRGRSTHHIRTFVLIGVAIFAGLLLPQAAGVPGPKANDEGWPQYRGGPDRNNYRKVKDKIRVPKVLWHLEKATFPAAVGDEVYAGGDELHLLDLKTGEIKASWKPEGKREKLLFSCTPVVLEDRVIAHTKAGKVHALSRDLKEVLWTVDVEGASFNAACDGEAYVLAATDRVAALEVQDGTERWVHNLSRLTGIDMSPALADGNVLFGAKNKIFYALDVKTGEEAWSFENDHPFAWTDPVVAYGKVFVGDRGGVIHAFDLKKGKEIWRQTSGATGLSEPGIMPGAILVGFSKFVATYDEKTGKPDMSNQGFKTNFNPFGSPTLVGGTLYFGNLDGHLYAYQYKNEKFLWAFELSEKQQVHDFIYHEDILLVCTTEGLYAIGNDQKKKKLPKNFVLIAEEEGS